MAQLRYILLESESINHSVKNILRIYDNIKNSNIELHLEKVRVENYQKNYLGLKEKWINREEIYEVVEKYTTKEHSHIIYDWLEQEYPFLRYPEIPATDFIYEIFTQYNSYLTLENDQ